jgi:short-subunit dehydrogenase
MTASPTPRGRALITGASGGIGAEFAAQLASQGWDLVLVARDARLEAVGRQLHDARAATVEVMPADLTRADDLRSVEARLEAAPVVDLLVNNAGFGTAGRFHELPIDREEDEVRLNVIALMRLAHAALAAMAARGEGAVINVSSAAGFMPGPGQGTYHATKAFVNSFTRALQAETRGTGVQVQLLCPPATATEFHQRAGIDGGDVAGGAWLTARQVVAASLEALDRGTPLCMPSHRGRLMGAVARRAPRPLARVYRRVRRR